MPKKYWIERSKKEIIFQGLRDRSKEKLKSCPQINPLRFVKDEQQQKKRREKG
jgi:hypothetical protein